MKHTTFRSAIMLISISLLSAFLAVIISNKFNTPPTLASTQETPDIKQYASMPYSPAIATDFTEAAAKAVDAVVHVTVVVETEAYTYGNSFFDFFFGEGAQPQTREQVGSGSGVIISKDGYIVTNNHVIDNSKKYALSSMTTASLQHT